MVYEWLPAIPDNCNDVKTNLPRPVVDRGVFFSHPVYTFALGFRQKCFRVTEGNIFAGFYFAKNKSVILFGNNINLAPAKTVITGTDFIAVGF